MATTYKASGMDHPAKSGLGVVPIYSEITIATALVVNDIIELFKTQKGMRILELLMVCNGTQSGNDSVCRVGDGGVNNRFITTAGGLFLRTGGARQAINTLNTGYGYVYTADDTVKLEVTTVGTGQTTGGKISCIAHVMMP